MASGTTGSQDTLPDPVEGRSFRDDAKASTIIMGTCGQEPLDLILLNESAKEQWDRLKVLYGGLNRDQLSAKVQAFTGFTVQLGTRIVEVATRLSTLQHEIGAIDPKE